MSYEVDPSEMEKIIIKYLYSFQQCLLEKEEYVYSAKGQRSFFDDEKKQKIVNFWLEFQRTYGFLPTKEEILPVVLSWGGEDEELRFQYKVLIDSIYDEPIKQKSKYIETEIINKIKRHRVITSMFLAKARLDKGAIDEGIVSLFEDALDVNFDFDMGTSITDVDKVVSMINYFNDESNVVSTGVTKLNDMLNGGFHKKELYVLAAPPGIGKTAFLGLFGLNAMRNGKNVIIFTFETSAERLMMRYYSNLLSKSTFDLMKDSDSIKETFARSMSPNWGDLIVKEFDTNGASVIELTSHLNNLQQHYNWKPDLIIVDYISIMRAADRSVGPDNSYKYYKTVSEELRNLAKKFEVPLLTASQINREGMAKEGGTLPIVSGKFISDSRGIYDTADFFATLNTNNEKKDHNDPDFDPNRQLITVHVDKNRNGPLDDILCSVNYKYMRVTF